LERSEQQPLIGLNPIDRSTGEIVGYEELQPYLEESGYNLALAVSLYREAKTKEYLK
jgi:hypothetical protein